MDTTETTRLRALLEGIAMPWKAQSTIVDGDEIECAALVLCPYGDDGDTSTVAEIDMGYGEECDDSHTALIVAAVNALPALCDKVEARDRELAAVTRERDQLVADVARLVGLDRTALPLNVRRAVEHELAERDAARDAADRVTAERDALLALAPHPSKRTGIRCARCGRDGGADVGDDMPVCGWCSDAVTVERERDDLRAVLETRNAELAMLLTQLAPLTRDVDALRAAARAAGWTDADATGETLVAWVRRGAHEACAARCDEDAEAEDALGRSGGAWALRHLAKSIRVRAKGGE